MIHSEATNLVILPTYSKRNTLELLPVVFFTISVFPSQEIFISICIQLFW